MGFISELTDTIKGIIGTIITVGIVLEIFAPGLAACLFLVVGFFMLLFSHRRGFGFFLMIFAAIWLYVVDYSLIWKFYEGIGVIDLSEIAQARKINLKKVYTADYVTLAYTTNDSSKYRKTKFDQDEEIELHITFDTSKAYVYFRDYPEEDLIAYFIHKGKKKKEKDPYAPESPQEDRMGFKHQSKSGIVWADDYKYLYMSSPAKDGYVNVFTLKEQSEYMEPGEWEVYLFMIAPDYRTGDGKILPHHGNIPFRKRFIFEESDFFRDLVMTPKAYHNRKSFSKDEMAVKVTFWIK